MCRRALVVAVLALCGWVAPAAAQTPGDYPPTIVPTSLVPPVSVTAPPEIDEEEVEVAEVEGGLARTGANNIGPLIQAGIVLLGAGTLLVLVARRRRAVRRAALS